MDDTLRNVAIGLAAFLAIHVSLEGGVKRSATHQIAGAFGNTGSIQLDMRPSGPLGLELNDYASINMTGRHVRLDHLPFFIAPKPGWKGSIHHFRIELDDFRLSELPVLRFRADLPHVSYDLGEAFNRGRLVLRGAQVGEGEVDIGPEGLRDFISNKYKKILSDVEVFIENHKIYLTGKGLLFGTAQPLSAVGSALARSGRFIDLSDATFQLDGKLVGPPTDEIILNLINPVLDLDADLGIGGYFTIKSVRVGDHSLDVFGLVSLPNEREEGRGKREETIGIETDSPL